METHDAFADSSSKPLKPGVSTAVDDATGSTPAPKSEETLDTLFGGKLEIFQSRGGYRFSLDALLLAGFVTVKRGERVVDLGTGNGVVALVLALRHPSITVTGLENQPVMAQRARKNVRQNRLGNRIAIVAGDVRAIEACREAASCDVVVSNPPYRKRTGGRISPNREKQIARHEITAHLDDFVRAAAYLLRAKGRLALVYSAERAVELLAAMRAMKLEPKRLRMVHAFAGAEATLALVEGVKGGRSGVKVLPPLIIYRKGKEYSDELAAIIAGTNK